VAEIFTEQCIRYLGEILHEAASSPHAERVFHLIVDRLTRTYHAQACAIILLDPQTEYLTIKNSTGISLTFSKQFRRHISTGPIGKLLWTGKPILVQHAEKEKELAEAVKLEHDFASCALVLLTAHHRSLGYLHIESAAPGSFSERDIPILTIHANIAALALERALLQEENLRLERFDRETALEKYSFFMERLREAIEHARHFQEMLALGVIDVDNFKDIVQIHGYETSRRFLRELAQHLRSHLRPFDAISRFGVDEFLVFFPRTSLSDARQITEQLRASVETSEFTEARIRSTISVGFSLFPISAASADDLLVKAKSALVEAQRGGRNRVLYEGDREIFR